jgi:hypothetical protein
MLELYRQAHVPCQRIDPSNNMPYDSKEFSAEKFSELIVEECVEFVFKKVGAKSALDLSKHFGVEE